MSQDDSADGAAARAIYREVVAAAGPAPRCAWRSVSGDVIRGMTGIFHPRLMMSDSFNTAGAPHRIFPCAGSIHQPKAADRRYETCSPNST